MLHFKLKGAFRNRHQKWSGRIRCFLANFQAWHPDARVVENGRLILHVPGLFDAGIILRNDTYSDERQAASKLRG